MFKKNVLKGKICPMPSAVCFPRVDDTAPAMEIAREEQEEGTDLWIITYRCPLCGYEESMRSPKPSWLSM
jgi:hypothetical protein